MKTFHRAFVFTILLLLFSAALPREAAAQCVDGASCSSDANCGADTNICNGTESCSGTCGSDVTFNCCVCDPAPPPLTPCGDDAIFCNGINVCDDSQTCVAEDTLFQNPRCGANGECADFCDEATDTCADPAGTSCTDDGNVCTTDACNGLGACVSSNNDLNCDDGVNCTDKDTCLGGSCAGTPIQCDDGISCTPDSCDEANGLCQADATQCECLADADCDDGNPCTDEFCCTGDACSADEALTCIRSNNTATCDDEVFCNGNDQCSGGTCSVHSGDPCSSGEQCDETCSEAADNCFAPSGTVCDDGNILTVDACDGGGKCAVVETFTTQGSTLGCSLSSGEGAHFGFGLLGYAAALGAMALIRVRQ